MKNKQSFQLTIRISTLALLFCVLGMFNAYGQLGEFIDGIASVPTLKVSGTLLTQEYEANGYPEYNGENTPDERYFDLKIPTASSLGNYNAIMLQAIGGDGGNAYVSSVKSHGGEAATVSATFKIADIYNNFKPGGTLRFIIGEKGYSGSGSEEKGGGGGGGTAIYYSRDSDANDPDWQLVMVAGGGGGAAIDAGTFGNLGHGGGGGKSTTAGGNGSGGGAGGINGLGGEGGGGGGLYDTGVKQYCWSSCANGQPGFDGDTGFPTGVVGGTYKTDGGFGFGSGGSGEGSDDHRHGGGGGGYSGGGRGGNGGAGGGGGSYASSFFTTSNKTLTGGKTGSDPNNRGSSRFTSPDYGSVSFKFRTISW